MPEINSHIVVQKLSQWYCRKYKHPKTTSSSNSTSNLFVSVLNANKAKAPRKLTPFHQYFKLHYITRIKTEYC